MQIKEIFNRISAKVKEWSDPFYNNPYEEEKRMTTSKKYQEEFYNDYLVFGEDSYNLLISLSERTWDFRYRKENLLPSNSFILDFILDDYEKLRTKKNLDELLIMKSLVENPKERVKKLKEEISLFRRKWEYVADNLEEYYKLYDSLDYTEKRIVSHISFVSGLDNEFVKKLNEKYGLR